MDGLLSVGEGLVFCEIPLVRREVPWLFCEIPKKPRLVGREHRLDGTNGRFTIMSAMRKFRSKRNTAKVPTKCKPSVSKRKANTKTPRKKHRLRKCLSNLIENGLVNPKPFFYFTSAFLTTAKNRLSGRSLRASKIPLVLTA